MSAVDDATIPLEVEVKEDGLQRTLLISIPDAYRQEKMIEKRKALRSKVSRRGGFRGKLPDKVMQQRYGKAIHEQVTGELIEEGIEQALEAQDFEPIVHPDLDIKQKKAGEAITYTLTFDIYPTIQLELLKKMQVECFKGEIDDNDVEKIVDMLKETHATFDDLERASEKGDYLEIDFKGTIDGEGFVGSEATDFKLQLGKNALSEEFDQQLMGTKVGDKKNFNVPFPLDYDVKHLAGKTAQFDVTVKRVMSINRAQLTETFLREELAIEDGTLMTLRQEIREQLVDQAEKASENLKRFAMMEQFLSLYDIPFPRSMLEDATEDIKKDLKDEHAQPGLPAFDEKMEEAKKEIKKMILLRTVARARDIEVDSRDMQQYIQMVADQFSDAEEYIDALYRDRDTMLELRATMLSEKVMSHLMEHVTWHEKKISYATLIEKNKAQMRK